MPDPPGKESNDKPAILSQTSDTFTDAPSTIASSQMTTRRMSISEYLGRDHSPSPGIKRPRRNSTGSKSNSSDEEDSRSIKISRPNTPDEQASRASTRPSTPIISNSIFLHQDDTQNTPKSSRRPQDGLNPFDSSFWDTGYIGNWTPNIRQLNSMQATVSRAIRIYTLALVNAKKADCLSLNNHAFQLGEELISEMRGESANIVDEILNDKRHNDDTVIQPSQEPQEEMDLDGDLVSRYEKTPPVQADNRTRDWDEAMDDRPGDIPNPFKPLPSNTFGPKSEDPVMKQILTMLHEQNSLMQRMNLRITDIETGRSNGFRSRPQDNSHQPLTTQNDNTNSQARSSNPTMANKIAPKDPMPKPINPTTKSKPESKGVVNNSNEYRVKKAARFIIRVQGGVEPEKQTPPAEIKHRIDALLKQHSGVESTTLTEAKWTAARNLALTFPPSTNLRAILNIQDKIKSALKLPNIATFTRDVSWSKVILANVTTGLYDNQYGRKIYDEDTLLAALKTDDFLKTLTITQTPRWVKRPEMVSGPKSSISFAFEDPDGTIVNKFMKQSMCLFASRISPKKWNDKPILKLCDNCLSYDHNRDGCRQPTRCGICGLKHSTDQHREKCGKCKSAATPVGEKCPHPPRCAACGNDGGEGHYFNSDTCPRRQGYRIPITTTLSMDPNVIVHE